MKIRLPWQRQKTKDSQKPIDVEAVLQTVKSRWNDFNGTANLWETGYINRAETEEDHYREGIWDFAYYVLNPVVKRVRPTDTVLEIGVGLGRIIACSARAFKQVYGIDISETVLQKAAAHLQKQGIANVTLKPTRGDSIPLEDSLIDYCYSYLVFQHIPSHAIVQNYVSEIYRVLKPKGLCRIQLAKADGQPHEQSQVDSSWTIDQRCTYDAESARTLFSQAGFDVLAIDTASAAHPWSDAISKRQLWVTAQKP